MAYSQNDDIMLQAVLGNIPGRYTVNKFGRTDKIDNGTVGDVCDTNTGGDFVWQQPTASRIHDISSTSADDASGGTGAQVIRVFGLTDWNSKEVYEDVVMNGTTAVATANSYVIIHRMYVVQGATNVGDITATAQVDNTPTAKMLAGKGQTLMAIYGVPSSQVFIPLNTFGSVEKGGSSFAVIIEAVVNPAPDTSPGLWSVKYSYGMATEGTNYAQTDFMPYAKIPGPAIIKIRAASTVNDSRVHAGFSGYLIDV